MSLFSHKQTYDPGTIAEFTEALVQLTKARDTAIQNFRLSKQSHYEVEYQLFTQNIASANKVLASMLKRAEKEAN